jgi:hypothetical protein
MEGLHVNDDLESMWKEAVVVQFKVQSRNLPGDTEKNHECLLRTEIGTRDLPNTKEC